MAPQGGDWRSLVTRDSVQAALATLPELRTGERAGHENRGVRVYNLSDELLTCRIFEAGGQEIVGHGRNAQPFNLARNTWDEHSGFMTSPETTVLIQGASGELNYFVNGDSSQGIIVLPKTEEGQPPEPAHEEPGGGALARLTEMGYPETQAAEALAHSNGDVQAAAARLNSPAGGREPEPPPGVEILIKPKTLADLKPHVPGGFQPTKGTEPDPLLGRREEDKAASQFPKFYEMGGRVIEAPDQGACPSAAAEAALLSLTSLGCPQSKWPSGSKRARRSGAWGFTPTTS